MPAKKAEIIELRRLEDAKLTVEVEGLTPIIPHKWSEKSKRMMPGHPDRDTMSKKGVRKPKEEAEACVYRLPDGKPGIPSTAFKAAMVSACRFFEKPSMTEAKLLFYVEGTGAEQLVPFAFDGDPILREDTPRNANGGADLRYRYAFDGWKATLTVRYIPTSISPESVIALIDAAGRVGVGDWRPGAPKSATGTFGQWRVSNDEQQVAS